MQTRSITNSGHPLTEITGNVLAGVNITFELVDSRCNPAGSFSVDGEYIAPGPHVATTDESGLFNITLPCTDNMVDQRQYLCTINHPDCPEFMAPLVYNAAALPWVDFMGSGTTPPAAVVDPFTRHIQDTAIHTPAGCAHTHIINITAAAALGGHRVATMSGEYADCSNPAHGSEIAGITLQAVDAGQPVEALHLGEHEELSWSWTVGQPVYLGHLGQLTGLTVGATYYLATTAGGVTTTAPSGAGNFVQKLGKAVTATELIVSANDPYYLA